MAILGKRKAASRKEPTADETLSAEEIFRRHFESQFAPINDDPVAKRRAVAEDGDEEEDSDEDASTEEEDDDDDDDEEGEDEWGGLSDDELSASDNEEGLVEVVDYSSSQPKTTSMSKSDLKSFMSSRPPSQSTKPKPASETAPTQPDKSLPEDAPSLLKQDLELRRLLSESHLLHSQPLAHSEPLPFSAGRTKLKATDMRIQALGSKTSILKQEKMPMNMRKGIIAHREAKEAKRRREAKENGIILERPDVKKKGRSKGKRDIGVDRPGIGRMRGAELRISEGDVRKIEGSRDAFGRKGGGRSGGRGGKRR